jgi:hypothetical protein
MIFLSPLTLLVVAVRCDQNIGVLDYEVISCAHVELEQRLLLLPSLSLDDLFGLYLCLLGVGCCGLVIHILIN